MKQLDVNPNPQEKSMIHNLAVLSLNVSNHGLSDQLLDDIALRFENKNFFIFDDENGSLHQKDIVK